MRVSRLLRGLVAAALGVAIPVAAAGGPSLYFSRWERTAVVVLASLGGLAFGYHVNLGGAKEVLRGPTLVAGLVFPPEIAAIVLAVQSDVHPQRFPWARFDTTPARILGLVLVALGPAVQVWAERTLGRQYIGQVGLVEGHQLVTGGPYRWVRHPAYGAELFADIGGGLAFGSWLGFGAALVILPVLAYRGRQEDRMLEAAFGEERRRMERTTKLLIPFVY